jgi:hypothetical protein
MRSGWIVAVGSVCAACATAQRHAPQGLGADATAPGPAIFAGDAGGGAFEPGDSGAGAGMDDAFEGPLVGPFHDFPASPVLDVPDGGTGAPSNAAQLFGPPSQAAATGGPCLVEPEVGALYPNNWLRPRFAWSTPNSEDLFELRVHVDNQADDLVVYTTQMQWTMPQAMWTALAAHSQDVPMTVAVRGGLVEAGKLTSEALGSSGPIGIAPASAPGTIVYWAIVNGAQTGVLKGFAIGDEGVASVLTPSQIQERGAGGVPCIGCHASTPDGTNVGFSIGYAEGSPGAYTDGIATIGKTATPGLVPSFLTADAKRTMDGSGPGQPAALRDGGRRRRQGRHDHVSLALSVESTGHRAQPHAGMGRIPDPAASTPRGYPLEAVHRGASGYDARRASWHSSAMGSARWNPCRFA